MAQPNTPITTPPTTTNSPSLSRRARAPAPVKEKSLRLLRMSELDKEFTRQTKQLSALTKKFGKRLTSFGPDKK